MREIYDRFKDVCLSRSLSMLKTLNYQMLRNLTINFIITFSQMNIKLLINTYNIASNYNKLNKTVSQP